MHSASKILAEDKPNIIISSKRRPMQVNCSLCSQGPAHTAQYTWGEVNGEYCNCGSKAKSRSYMTRSKCCTKDCAVVTNKAAKNGSDIVDKVRQGSGPGNHITGTR